MRHYDISTKDAEAVTVQPMETGADDRGNPRLTGVDRNGRAIIVVIAKDNPNFVITTFPDD